MADKRIYLTRHGQTHHNATAGESYADADLRAQHALVGIGMRPVHRPLVVSHEMIGRMLQRHLLGLDPRDALARAHPNDVIYAIDPGTRAIQQLR